MPQPQFSIRKAREIDLVDHIESLSHHPQKISGSDYWYLSRLRIEKTPSFKVNRKLNVWYDHGIGKGGNIIDFSILYFNCSVKVFLQHLQAHPQKLSFSFHPQFTI